MHNVCVYSLSSCFLLIEPALLNVIEAILNIEYLYLRHTSPHNAYYSSKSDDRPNYHPHAPLIGFASALMTLAKTALYFLQGEPNLEGEGSLLLT